MVNGAILADVDVSTYATILEAVGNSMDGTVLMGVGNSIFYAVLKGMCTSIDAAILVDVDDSIYTAISVTARTKAEDDKGYEDELDKDNGNDESEGVAYDNDDRSKDVA